MPEAELRREDGGLVPDGDGWFVVNVAEARGTHSDRFGTSTRFEDRSRHPFADFGINVRLLQPGQPASLYHGEGAQEAFLVLSGECLAIVEDRERPLRTGDFLHTPAWTPHVIVGAGDGPSSVLMVGTRREPEEVVYPVSEVAARYGASVEKETRDATEAYAGTKRLQPATLSPLPW